MKNINNWLPTLVFVIIVLSFGGYIMFRLGKISVVNEVNTWYKTCKSPGKFYFGDKKGRYFSVDENIKYSVAIDCIN